LLNQVVSKASRRKDTKLQLEFFLQKSAIGLPIQTKRDLQPQSDAPKLPLIPFSYSFFESPITALYESGLDFEPSIMCHRSLHILELALEIPTKHMEIFYTSFVQVHFHVPNLW